MTTLRTYCDCVEYFRSKVEKQGYRFDFINNPYTASQFVVINGCRSKVKYEGAGWSSVPEIYKALKRACNEAYFKATK